MGSVEQFPADIDELPDDKPTQPQHIPTCAAPAPATPAAAHAPKQPLTSPTSHGNSGGSSWVPLTPASSAPSARVLNEFALPDSLVQLFRQQETAHTACTHTQLGGRTAHDESKQAQLKQHSRTAADEHPLLSRELQLRFILQQAEAAHYFNDSRSSSAPHPPPHPAPQQSASKAAARGGDQWSATAGVVRSAVPRMRVQPVAPLRKKDGWIGA